ncbi:MAG: hypothetical protein KDA51_13220 [Planctomycetales bacterium]|nr:hypothetical protein [Planctomycetales bacterium]MCA9182417.1 hypothetical protein [Planctomycetales bacterium]
MAKRKNPQRGQRTFTSPATPGDRDPPAPDPIDTPARSRNQLEPPQIGWPPAWVRNTVSLLILLHGLALIVAVSSNLAPSYLQGRILTRLAPYLNMTHQAYNALPLELTRGELADFPLRVELQMPAANTAMDVAGQVWQPMTIATLVDFAKTPAGQPATRWANLARWLSLTASADPEDEILSDFSARCVALAEKQTGQRYSGVRLISPKVLSYDEDMALAGGIREPTDEVFRPTVVYSANIVRLHEGTKQERLSLVPAQPAARTAKPTSSAEVQP